MPKTITDIKRYNRMLKRGLAREQRRFDKMQKLDQENNELLQQIMDLQSKYEAKFGKRG